MRRGRGDDNMTATERDISHINALYAGRQVYFGELHDHAATGGTSDGKCSLAHWRGALKALNMDFAAILDHRQVRHMYLPEWKDGLFICGTEPGTVIEDSGAEFAGMHYNMIFPSPQPLEALLAEFPEFAFTGGEEGHFVYPNFTRERFGALIDAVRAHGGFFVHPHPKKMMHSDNPLDYWFRDETGLEVIYRSADSDYTAANYTLWTSLLSLGKRVWATAGGDWHKCAHDGALTAIYAEAYTNVAFLPHLRVGDFSCGGVGFWMCVGDTRMGGKCDFSGKRLILRVGEFHRSLRNPEHRYRLDLLDDRGIVCSTDISCDAPTYLALDAQPCAFYRAEVVDVTRNLRIALSNPIWCAE